ncbi:hypothetical protein DL769_010611 [Monosporascus sp. CRB-8-3]|nr:hypothetical protein DL769_010611 [Monosporascus sp. CRB-8-3]
MLATSHGHDILPLERREFLQVMYYSLPDKSTVRTACSVKEIKQFADGVEVKLSDGMIERGDIVLGCDGVHSSVRSMMWDYADKTSPGLITAKKRTGDPEERSSRWKRAFWSIGTMDASCLQETRCTGIALGGNTAVEDIVVLTNYLHRLLQGGNAKPSAAAFNGLFSTYESERMKRIKWATNTSGVMSHVQAQTTPLYKVAAWLLPLLPDRGAADQLLAEYIRAGPKLDFLSVQGFAPGRLPWKDDESKTPDPGSEAIVRSGAPQGAMGRLLVTMGAAMGAAALVSATRHMLFPLAGP